MAAKASGADNVVHASFGQNPALLLNEKGKILPCEHNALELLRTDDYHGALHFDRFLYRVRIGPRDWSDQDDRAALCGLQAVHRVHGFTLGQVRSAVLSLAYERQCDSLEDHVLGLAKWDGVSRIEMAFCDAWGAPDDPVTRAASRNLFVAMIARALRPGAQVDTLWVFEGPQGSGKSAALRALGGNFHAEISAPIGSTDFMREMRGLWLAEMSELDSLRASAAATIKRLLSAPSDRFVEKFEKHTIVYPRRAVAVATTNEHSYWLDATGARRLIPIKTGSIQVALIEENREQYFAEAFQLFIDGNTWWEYPPAISTDQEERQQPDPWEDIIRALIASGGTGTLGWVSSATIMADWLRLASHQQGHACGVRLGRVMRRLGFRPQRQGKGRERGWITDISNHAG